MDCLIEKKKDKKRKQTHFAGSGHDLILSFLKSQGILLKLFLDLVSGSPSDNVVTRVGSLFSWRLKLHVSKEGANGGTKLSGSY